MKSTSYSAPKTAAKPVVLSDTQRKLLTAMNGNGRMDVDAISSEARMPKGGALSSSINGMVSRGLLTAYDNKSGTKYVISPAGRKAIV